MPSNSQLPASNSQLLRILAVLYVLAILTVTLLPSGADTFAAGWDTRITPGIQNTLHMPAYIVMVPLLMAAFGRSARRPWLALGLITLGCITLGIGTECLQAAFIPGRYGSLTDALSNTLGCLLGAGSWKLVARSWKLVAGSWKLGAGSWEIGVRNPLPTSASECRVGGSGQSDNRTFSTYESQPCECTSQQVAPGRVHPRGDSLVSDEQRVSASPTSSFQLPTSIGTILCFASGYDAPPTSKHHVMHVLADQGNTVLWVNYHASRMPTASGSDLRYIARKLRQVAGGLKNPRTNVYVLTPLVVPLPSSAFARRLNRALLTWQIRRALRKVSPGPNTPLELWSFTPDVAYLLDRFGQQRVVYYCVDDHSQFTGYDTRQVLRDEEALCRRADLVVTTSGPLQESRKPWNPNTILVPHGVDYEHFAQALDDNLPEPAELAAIPRPRLGFFGLLRDWVDLDLLAEVARRRPDWHVVLLGDSTVDLSPYRSLANMHFLGPKPYGELPAWCRGFDVGLIPFKLNPLTHAVNPIKLREYLAAGLPVVSTPLPEVERYAQGVEEVDSCQLTVDSNARTAAWVSLADGPDAWTDALDAIVREEGVRCQVSGVSESPAPSSQLPASASACRVGGSGQSQNRTSPTGEPQPCDDTSQQAAPGRVHPRVEPAANTEQRVSAVRSANSELRSPIHSASASARAARSAAMRSETWQAKVRRIRETLEAATAED